jgi:hypothetical protein
MRNLLLLSITIVLVFFTSCNKEKFGDVVFWQKTGSGYGATEVKIDGKSALISEEKGSKPGCSEEGCAVFKQLKVGTYDFYATDGDVIWEGEIVVQEGCYALELQ